MAKPGTDFGAFREAEALDVSSTDADLTFESQALFVGGAGIVKVDMAGSGTAVQFTCPAGALLPIAVNKVYNADTTATLIVALR